MSTTPGIARRSRSKAAGASMGRTAQSAIWFPLSVTNGTPSGRAERRPAAQRGQLAHRQRPREGNHLDRQSATAAQHRHQLLAAHQGDPAARRLRHDPLPHERAAIALDQVEVGIHLVRPVHRDVENPFLQADHRHPDLSREPRRCLRRGHAPNPQPARHPRPQRPDERGRRAARAQPHQRPVADMLQRPGGQPFELRLPPGSSRSRSGSLQSARRHRLRPPRAGTRSGSLQCTPRTGRAPGRSARAITCA